ncbi:MULTISPECIES: hypothetical protein [unclassified Bradyrhizobium]
MNAVGNSGSHPMIMRGDPSVNRLSKNRTTPPFDDASRDRRIRGSMIAQTIGANKQMLQKTLAALPITRIRELAFEGAFFSIALVAMAGWVYFIAFLLLKLTLWFFG